MVVEDVAVLRQLYRTTLALDGFDVVTAEDGLDALQQIESRVPDLIVLDLSLPRVSGRDVQAEIEAHAQTRRIPIVVVTSETGELDPVAFPCVLRKPIDSHELVRVVKRCLQQVREGRLSGLPG
jgi:chemosensory pili system protein ChpA (sensor histidine kinase/response regulator)